MDAAMYQKLDSGTISTSSPAPPPQVIQRSVAKRATKTDLEQNREATAAAVPEKKVSTQSTLPEPNEGYNAMQIGAAGNPMTLKSVNPAGELNKGADNQNQVIPPAGNTFYRTVSEGRHKVAISQSS